MSAGVEDVSRAGGVRADDVPAMSTGRLMIFHAPFPLRPDRVAASMLRPLAMRQAFADLGYRVVDVTGYAAQRRRAMARVRAALAAGAGVEFVYSENATIPNSLTEPRHLPVPYDTGCLPAPS